MSNAAGGVPGGGARAIVAGHGEFAAGLISAVEQITAPPMSAACAASSPT